MQNISEKLKKIRIEANLTQQELASELGKGYTRQVVYSIEKGTRKVGFEVCQNWADACGYEFTGEFTKK